MRWGAAALLALAPCIVVAQQGVDRRLSGKQADEYLYVWSGSQLRAFAPGFEDLLADLYWLRTVQYYGGQQAYEKHPNYSLLKPLANITTDLDPRLEIAYRYGAVFLSEPFPIGAGAPHDGTALLAKGARAMPDSWRLRQDLGFFNYVYLKDAATAGTILMDASRIPGAPFWLKTLAARVLEGGGERSQARLMWQAMHDQGEDGALRENAGFNLRVIDALDMRDALQEQVERFRASRGGWPATLDELRRAGLLARPATDPAGVPFDYDKATGKVNVGKASALRRPRDDVH